MLTVDDAKSWHMRNVAHYNGGKEWFGYGHQCVEQPRLYRLDKYLRKDRSVQSIWSVDGVDCADLAEAVGRLNTDPVVTDAEMPTLALFTPEPQPFREIRGADGYDETARHFLSHKGLIRADDGQASLTELGDRLLSQARMAAAREGGE